MSISNHSLHMNVTGANRRLAPNLPGTLPVIHEADLEDTFQALNANERHIDVSSDDDLNDRDLADIDQPIAQNQPAEDAREEEKEEEIENWDQSSSFTTYNDRDISGLETMFRELNEEEAKIRKQNKNKVPFHIPVQDLNLDFEPPQENRFFNPGGEKKILRKQTSKQTKPSSAFIVPNRLSRIDLNAQLKENLEHPKKKQ
jgi:hypothetical protein